MQDKIYTLHHQDKHCKARTGEIKLGHGVVQTPAFMPVGTNGTVKGIHHEDIAAIGYNLILGNTYHLYLRPGIEVLKKFDGLHKFSNWNGNILTDSGGFQVFSLSQLRKISEQGVKFQSHIDGSKHEYSPEKVVDIQQVIGSDIAMMLDVCSAPGISWKDTLHAMDITHNWAERAIIHRDSLLETTGRAFRGKLFGIVQGGFYEDLRIKSAQIISSMDFPGIAIGGLSVGESKEDFCRYLAVTAENITDQKPRYVMGIGTPDYILEAIENGIDLFDCVLQTRTARNGSVFTDDGMLTLSRSFNEFDLGPIQEGCTCRACTKYSLSYMRHMFKCNEMLGGMLATEHNLTYLYNLMARARKAIEEDRFKSFKEDYLKRFYANGGRCGKR
ncbi:MAG: tRNA guanosine(34) transglycosylase Tgt [Sphaerochaetaceae bacterium]|nr:tRNA guanosine(34) transglycosylase Tgt [Sphaerochaetaceae bacterium]